ncbi:MAG: NAD-dependent epimerase/dehydratase family protein [Cyanobacteria bacterium P01_D01_bin.73]
MKILILGGTVFLGRAIANAALVNGHDVTLFNRGVSTPDPFVDQGFPNAERLTQVRGDRRDPNAVQALITDETWDAIIDTCGTTLEVIANTASLIGDQLERSPHFRYVYISTIAVYEDFGIPGITESDTLRSPPRTVEIADEADDGMPTVITKNPATAANSGGVYGTERADCERSLEKLFKDHPANLITLRPSLLVGPGDPTDRLTYWVRRLTQPGEAIVPNAGQQFLQWVDVRDLAAWILVLLGRDPLEEGQIYFPRVFNVGQPEKELTLGDVWRSCLALVDEPAMLVPMDELFLLESGVQPWLDVPLWVPSFDKTMRGFTRMDTRKAERYGLVLRPISDTLKDIFEWDQRRTEASDSSEQLRSGIGGDRQTNLLKSWSEKGVKIEAERAIAPAPPEQKPSESELEAWLIEGDD